MVLDPVVLQDQQHLLRAAEGDDGEEDLAPAGQHPVHHSRGSSFAFRPRGVRWRRWPLRARWLAILMMPAD